MNDKKDFLNEYAGNKLKAYRESANLTQQQLADKLGIKQQNIARYELGQRTFKMNIVIMLANFFDKKVSDFFPPEHFENKKEDVDNNKEKENLFSKNLKYLREINNLTQEELSSKLNITRAKLGHLETGRREPNLKDIEKICNFFNIQNDIILINMKDIKKH